ncbi:MAG: phage major capsid protein [Pseudomonadota bacterium]
MSIQQLRERRNALAADARKLMDETKDAKWTSEHQTKYDSLTGEITDLDQKIAREQKVLDLMADEEFSNVVNNVQHKKGETQDPLDPKNLFNAWLRNGVEGLTVEQSRAIYNTMSTTTGSQGGYTVPSDVSKRLIDSLKSYGGMRTVAEILTTSTGAPLSFPTSDGTAEVGELVAENATATALDPSFGTMSLGVFRFSSKIVAIPFELLQDSIIDVEGFVNKRLATRLGRITNQKYTTGAGTTEPMGVVTAAGSGKVGATGKTLTFDYDDLVDTQESVDDAYTQGGRGSWMFSQTVRKGLRKLKDTAGRPIWTPGYEYGVTAGVPDLLLGSNVYINNDMAVPAANAKSIIYGDLSQYIIRDSMQVSLFRFTDSAYTKLGQVGFLAFMRTGGNLADAAAVKYYQHSAT